MFAVNSDWTADETVSNPEILRILQAKDCTRGEPLCRRISIAFSLCCLFISMAGLFHPELLMTSTTGITCGVLTGCVDLDGGVCNYWHVAGEDSPLPGYAVDSHITEIGFACYVGAAFFALVGFILLILTETFRSKAMTGNSAKSQFISCFFAMSTTVAISWEGRWRALSWHVLFDCETIRVHEELQLGPAYWGLPILAFFSLSSGFAGVVATVYYQDTTPVAVPGHQYSFESTNNSHDQLIEMRGQFC